MTNKLVVIIISLKLPTIKKTLLYDMKIIVPNYSCLQNPWLGDYRPPRSPFFLSSVLKWICWTTPPPEKNSWVRHCSELNLSRYKQCSFSCLHTVQTDAVIIISSDSYCEIHARTNGSFWWLYVAVNDTNVLWASCKVPDIYPILSFDYTVLQVSSKKISRISLHREPNW